MLEADTGEKVVYYETYREHSLECPSREEASQAALKQLLGGSSDGEDEQSRIVLPPDLVCAIADGILRSSPGGRSALQQS